MLLGITKGLAGSGDPFLSAPTSGHHAGPHGSGDPLGGAPGLRNIWAHIIPAGSGLVIIRRPVKPLVEIDEEPAPEEPAGKILHGVME